MNPMRDEQQPGEQQPANTPDATPSQQPAQNTQPSPQQQPAETAPDFGLQELTRGAPTDITTSTNRVDKRG